MGARSATVIQLTHPFSTEGVGSGRDARPLPPPRNDELVRRFFAPFRARFWATHDGPVQPGSGILAALLARNELVKLKHSKHSDSSSLCIL